MKDRLQQLAAQCMAMARRGPGAGRAGGRFAHARLHASATRHAVQRGLWLAGHAEAFIDNAALAMSVRDWLDASPLGTASGFGVNLPLPRGDVAEQLGFARVLVNPQYAQNSRGKIELQALSALGAATGDLRRLAWDLSLFTTSEFDFVRLGNAWCTGSSIMPNKRNPDAVELLRAAHAVVVAVHVPSWRPCCRCPRVISAICRPPNRLCCALLLPVCRRWPCCRRCWRR